MWDKTQTWDLVVESQTLKSLRYYSSHWYRDLYQVHNDNSLLFDSQIDVSVLLIVVFRYYLTFLYNDCLTTVRWLHHMIFYGQN
uniref:Ovule protein n=1 Tax=Schistosoma curassoni TaxID=6186 RepID=A0A183KF53_9TREM